MKKSCLALGVVGALTVAAGVAQAADPPPPSSGKVLLIKGHPTGEIHIALDKTLCVEGKTWGYVVAGAPGADEVLSIALAAKLSGRTLRVASTLTGGLCKIDWVMIEE